MKNINLLLLLTTICTSSVAMQPVLEFLNLHTPPKTYEQHCIAQREKLENFLQQDSDYFDNLLQRSTQKPTITTDGQSAEEFIQERNTASTERARLLKRQGTKQRYKDGVQAALLLGTGIMHAGYRIWFTKSEQNEDRQIITATTDFWPDIVLILTGAAGIVKFFKNTNGKILDQSIKESDALSGLQDVSLHNQEQLIKLLQKRNNPSLSLLDAQLAAMEANPPAVSPSTTNAMQKLSARGGSILAAAEEGNLPKTLALSTVDSPPPSPTPSFSVLAQQGSPRSQPDSNSDF